MDCSVAEISRPRVSFGRLWLAATIGAGLMIGIAGNSLGQFGNVPTNSEQADLFRPAPRVLQQQLRRAEKAIADEDYRSAVELLGAILTGQTQDPDLAEIRQDYFVRELGDTSLRTSVKAKAMSLLGKLPAEGRQWFELKFGTEAAQLVKQAVADRDVAQLHDVTRKYFHTQAGYDAAMLVGRWQLDQGHPLAAALSLKRLYDVPHARAQYEPTLSLMLAACWLRAGMSDAASEVLKDLRKTVRSQSVTLGGKSVRWFSVAEDPAKWLEENLGGAGLELHQREQQWIVFRGNPQRNGMTEGGAPLMQFRWRAATVLDPTDADIVAAQRMAFESEGRTVIPMFQPLAVGDLIVMRTPERVFGVDLRTGKRIWDYPWFQETLEQSDDEKDYVAYGNRGKRSEQLRERLWEDAPYGQLSSDGQRVFLLDGLQFTSTSTSDPRIMMFPQRLTRQAQPSNRTNQLVACSIEEEGKLQWIVGGTSGEDEPELAGAFFLGPPLPLMGQLFALAELNGEIRVVALDATNGSLLWYQQVAHVAELTIDRDPNRRLAGATPSFDDGILVCPTSAGACVAVDLATRSLLWGYQYPAFRPSTTRFRSSTPFPDLGDRWVDGTAVLAEGCVFLTPVESSQLHCLDLITGKLRWEPIDRDGMLFIGGVYEGLVFLVGSNRCRAIRVSDGSPAWDADLELGSSHPTGRGFLTGRYYFLPTVASEILKIDITTGKVAETIPTDQPLGNLISYRDQIISQNVDWLACYYQAEPLRWLVAKKLKENPQDSWALLRRAELELHDGDRDAALATLRTAHRLTPNDEAAKGLLVSTLMDALREDFAQYRHMADEVKQLIDQPRQRLEYLRLMVDGSTQLKDWDAAWTAIRELIASTQSFHDSSLLGELTAMLRLDPAYRVRFDRWLAARTSLYYENADDAHRKEFDAALARQLADAGDDVLALRRLLSIYGATPAADEIRLQLASALIEDGESIVEAELLISDLVDPNATGNAAHQARALALEVELLQRESRPREALRFVQRILNSFGDETIGDRPAREWAAEKMTALMKPDGRLPKWPTGAVEVTKSQDASLSPSYVYAFANADLAGAAAEGTRARYEISRRTLRVTDAFGSPELELNLGTYFNATGPWPFQVHQRGHMMLANLGFEVLMVNWLSVKSNQANELLWRQDISSVLNGNRRTYRTTRTTTIQGDWGGPRYRAVDHSTQTPLGHAGPFLSHSVVYQKLRELVCVDPVSGEVLWSRGGFDPGCELFGDQTHIFVIEPDSEEAVVLRTWDGAELGRRKVPPLTQRWAARHGRLLTCQRNDDGVHISLRDLWEDRDVWQLDVPPDTLLRRVEHDEIAVVTRDGKVRILNIDTGNAMIESQIDRVPAQIDQLYVMRSSGDYLVLLSGDTPTQGSIRFSSPIPSGCPLISGTILCLDRKTGQPLWSKPGTIAGYAVPLAQPAESPVLVLLRQTEDRSRLRNPGPSSRPSILCIDRRYGNVILDEEYLQRATNYGVLADPERSQVQVRARPYAFTFKFTDKKLETPREPIQMELKAMLKVSDAIESVGKMAEELFKGLGGQPPAKQKKQEEEKDDPPKAPPPK